MASSLPGGSYLFIILKRVPTEFQAPSSVPDPSAPSGASNQPDLARLAVLEFYSVEASRILLSTTFLPLTGCGEDEVNGWVSGGMGPG